MSKKLTGIVSYLSWIGWIIAFAAGDREGAKFHLNQSLVLLLANLVCGVISHIPLIKIVAGLINILLVVCWVMGFIHACREEEKEVPLLGGVRILK